MKKKNGFIATSLIYSFFLVFITLFLTIIADYLQNKVLLNTIESDIKEEINATKSIGDFKIGDILVFESGNYGSLKCSNDNTNYSSCSNIDNTSYTITDIIVYDGEKIDTLVLKDIEGNVIYIRIDEKKFKINTDAPENSGLTITGVL